MPAITVNYTPQFLADLERLDDKYPGAFDQVDSLLQQLKRGERPGDRVPKVGYLVYKVRLPNPAARRGKSGGFRAVYYLQTADQILMLILYSKNEMADVSTEYLRAIIEEEESR